MFGKYLIICFLLSQFDQFQSADYIFKAEYGEVFKACDNQPKARDINYIGDLSNLTYDYDGDYVIIGGNLQLIWDIEPTDRIAAHVTTYKWTRGTWEPTLFNVAINNVCKEMWKTNSVVYQVWTQYVDPEDHNCLNEKGKLYRMTPFPMMWQGKLQGHDFTGKYKMHILLDAFDANNKKRNPPVCIALEGDVELA